MEKIPKISSLTKIFSGTYQKAGPEADVIYLQLKDFDEHGRLNQEILPQPILPMHQKLEKHLLQDQDILLASKGDQNLACVYEKDIGPAVASSNFFVLRINNNKLRPRFLHWYLNTEETQKALRSMQRGTHIPSLSKKSLVDLEIKVPPLEQQNKILRFQQLWLQEKHLLQELLHQKAIFYEKALLTLTQQK